MYVHKTSVHILDAAAGVRTGDPGNQVQNGLVYEAKINPLYVLYLTINFISPTINTKGAAALCSQNRIHCLI